MLVCRLGEHDSVWNTFTTRKVERFSVEYLASKERMHITPCFLRANALLQRLAGLLRHVRRRPRSVEHRSFRAKPRAPSNITQQITLSPPFAAPLR